MRIDLLLDSRQFGGIEAHVGELAKALTTAGHTVTVIFICDYGTHPLKTTLAQQNLPFICLNGNAASVIKTLGARRPDALHTHGYKAGILGRLAAQLGGFGCCSSYHAGEPGRGRVALYNWVDRMTACTANQIIAVSQKIAAQLPPQTRVLNNFVDAQQPISQGLRIAYVGRLSEEKGPDRFIAAAKQLPTQQWHVYGDGPLRNTLEVSASHNVTFHGSQAMHEHWQHIGLVVMPSRFEGLPLAALEAMARGIPVLASAVGDLPRLIQHNSNGWLIHANTEAAIANTIACNVRQWCALTQQRRNHIQQQAKNTVQAHYSADAVIPQFIHCYQQAATQGARYA